MSTSLAITQEQSYWSEKQIAALKQLGLANANPADLAVFFHQAQKTGLDPFARQIYMIERGGRFTIQSSIDGLRIVALRSGNYGGQTPAEWCGDDGVWKDVWLDKNPPLAARVGVYYKDAPNPTYATAKWDSYAQTSPIWRKMPDLMLAKCAEALALRKAFPNDLSGIYSDEEMAQADSPDEKIKPVKVDLHLATPTEPVNTAGVNWVVLKEALDNLSDVDGVKNFWNARKEILDAIVPDTNQTLRQILLDKVEAINA